MFLMKNKGLGRSLQFSASLLDIPSTTPSCDINNSIINLESVTILNYTIIFMIITLNLAIKNSHFMVEYRETDCWTKNILIVNLSTLKGNHNSKILLGDHTWSFLFGKLTS